MNDPAADRDVCVARWFEAHAATIYRYAVRRVGEDTAYDVTAETFRVAIERHERFDPALGSELSWLYGIATNVLAPVLANGASAAGSPGENPSDGPRGW